MRPAAEPSSGDAEVLAYRDEVAVVRPFTADRARRAGLAPDRVDDLIIAVASWQPIRWRIAAARER